MANILKAGQEIKTENSGFICKIDKFIASGGQGEIYSAKFGDLKVAVKWYFKKSATESQKNIIKTLIKKMSPSNKYLWPIDILDDSGIEGFGYIMPFKSDNYESLISLVGGTVKISSMRVLCETALQLVESFLLLHTQKGLCYGDISFSNIFFDHKTGDILICDNDNVVLDNSIDSFGGGTPGFIAPEVLKGEKKAGIDTDRFSLAVLLFYLFFLHHPLLGKKEDGFIVFDHEANFELYATNPIFIFDPDNDSNRPLEGEHDNAIIHWEIYPEEFKNTFIKAFTTGLKNSHQRVVESEWKKRIISLRDNIYRCSHCSKENFYDIKYIKASKGSLKHCWNCKNLSTIPPRIKIGDNMVILDNETMLYPHHISGINSLYDFSKPLALVSANPNNPSILGLKNLSNHDWNITKENGEIITLPKEKTVRISNNNKINFGTSEGIIRL